MSGSQTEKLCIDNKKQCSGHMSILFIQIVSRMSSHNRNDVRIFT